MRFIFCNHDHALTSEILAAMANKMSINAVDIIEGPGFAVPDHLNYRYFSREDLYFGRYDIDWSTVRPLDQEVLDELSEAELIGRLMYLRNDKYQNKLRFMRNMEAADELITADKLRTEVTYKMAFYRHVRFWHDYLLKTRPDAFIHVYGAPHLYVEFIIWQLCKLMGIPSVWLMPTAVYPKMLVMTDLDVSRPDFKAAIARRLRSFHDDGTIPDIDRYVQRFVDEQLNTAADPHPKYIQRGLILRMRGRSINSLTDEVKGVVRDALDAILGRHSVRFAWLKHRLYWDLVRADWAMDRRYDQLTQMPDLAKNYIYFPLHYTPEETSLPKGGVYANQILIAEMLSYHLPKGWQIYVKEHPAQGSYGREPNLYDELVRLPGVTLIGRDANTFELIRKCRAVATISGTAGIEALMRGKPVLTFGAAFYAHAPGSYRIVTSDDCGAAMEVIAKGAGGNSRAAMLCFLRALQDCAIDAVIPNTGDPNWRDFPSREQICENIARAFTDVLLEPKRPSEAVRRDGPMLAASIPS